MQYHIITYGCQMNKSDSERIASFLERNGLQKASTINEADLVIINACSVRQSAIDRVYGKINQIKKLYPKTKIFLTGCLLKQDKGKLKNKADLIFGIQNLSLLAKKIKKLNADIIKKSYFEIPPQFSSYPVAYIPIMTGCNNYCVYCVVPYTRGPEISRSPEEIIKEVQIALAQNYKEIWLLGQNVNSYKSKTANFPQLLRMIDNLPGDFWIRFTSSHPKDFSDELIEIIASAQKITPYLNLPVQSGDDTILKKMRRPYTIAQYKNLVKKIRKKIPNISLSTDVIVGFPGETKKQFENTVKLFKEIKFDMAYIAEYSRRAGTEAAKFPDNVPVQEKQRRRRILEILLKEIALERNQRFLGKEVRVLVYEQKEGFLIGKSEHYKTVKIELPAKICQSKTDFRGKFITSRIKKVFPWGLKGCLV